MSRFTLWDEENPWFKVAQGSPAKTSRQSSSGSGVPLPKLPAASSPTADEDESEFDGDESRDDDEEEEENSGDDTATTNEDSHAVAVTRAKLLQKTAKLGQSILPQTNASKSRGPTRSNSNVATYDREPHRVSCSFILIMMLKPICSVCVFAIFQSLTTYSYLWLTSACSPRVIVLLELDCYTVLCVWACLHVVFAAFVEKLNFVVEY